MGFATVSVGIVILCQWSLARLEKGHCAFPDQPANGNANVKYKQKTEIAYYNCPNTFVIDGDLTRICNGGQWSGAAPRCAVDVDNVSAVTYGGTSTKQLTDRMVDTCLYVHAVSSLNFLLPKEILFTRVTVVSPVPYNDLILNTKWTLTVKSGNEVVKKENDGVFKDAFFASDQYASVQWNLNETGDSIHLTLEKGDPYLCEIYVHAVPDECGEPEVLINGHVQSIDSKRIRYSCAQGFKSDESDRHCVQGRWTGDLPKCQVATSAAKSMMSLHAKLIYFAGSFLLILQSL